MSVPRSYLRALTGPTGDGQRPVESKATEGSRFYDATAFVLANPSPAARQMSFVYPLENAPATDFLLPGPTTDAAGAKQTEGASPSTSPVPGACVSRRLLRSARVKPRSRGRARFAFARRANAGGVRVDVFQTARGRRVVGQRLVARFRGRKRSFTWNGRPNRRAHRVTDGYFFVRFTARGSGGSDVRRVALRRTAGRFHVLRRFHRHSYCDLIPLYKLTRPVFGGSNRRPLGVAFRLSSAARVGVVVRRGKRVIRRFAVRPRQANRVVRLRLRPRRLRRGTYSFTLTARQGQTRVVTRLYARRI